MATQQATLRLVVEHRDDETESPSKEFDESAILDSYTDLTPGRKYKLAAAGADVAITFSSACCLLIYSHDYPFKLRLKAAETLLTNLKAFLVWGDDTDEACHTTSVLLTGNGDNVAELEIWIVEKP